MPCGGQSQGRYSVTRIAYHLKERHGAGSVFFKTHQNKFYVDSAKRKQCASTIIEFDIQFSDEVLAKISQLSGTPIEKLKREMGALTERSGNSPEYFLGDALGSVRQMADQAGTVMFAQNYNPYGMVTQTSSVSHTDYGFTGESYGDSTQLIYLRARYYNPADGRFQSRDTWGGDANRSLSLNRWMYVEGNPINYTDPSGKKVYDTKEDAPLNNARVGNNYLQDAQETYFTLDPQSSDKDADAYTAVAGPNAPVTPLDYIIAAAECAGYLEQFEWWRHFTRWGSGYGPDAKTVVNYYRFAGIRTDDLRGIAVSHVAIYAYTIVDDVVIKTKVSDKYGIYGHEETSPSIPESLTTNVDRSSHSYYYNPEIPIFETPEDRFSIKIEVYFSVRYGPLSYKGKTVHEISP